MKRLFLERPSPPKVGIGNWRLEQEMRTGWISYHITFQNDVISGCELITPLDRVVVLNRDHHNFLHLYLISLKALISRVVVNPFFEIRRLKKSTFWRKIGGLLKKILRFSGEN